MKKQTILDHNQLIFSLAERLRDDVWDYGTAIAKCKSEGVWEGDYMRYLDDKSKSKTAIKRKIVDLKQELEKLSKRL